MPEHRERRVTFRLVRQGEEERAFDAAFWRELGPAKRLEVLWDMVLESGAWKGSEGGQPRLQRSVLRVERR
jgi:hypothetical protein